MLSIFLSEIWGRSFIDFIKSVNINIMVNAALTTLLPSVFMYFRYLQSNGGSQSYIFNKIGVLKGIRHK